MERSLALAPRRVFRADCARCVRLRQWEAAQRRERLFGFRSNMAMRSLGRDRPATLG